jgi:hypothetical protein
MPRKHVAAIAPGLDDMVGRSMPRRREPLQLLVGYVQLLRTDASVASPELQRLAVKHIHNLIVLAIGATRDGAALAAGPGLRAARLRAAKADIADDFASPGLSAVAVAGRQVC